MPKPRTREIEIDGHIYHMARDERVWKAEAKKFFIESARLRKWRTSGILWWNVIDGWPQFSDAVVDYYFGKKLHDELGIPVGIIQQAYAGTPIEGWMPWDPRPS